MAAPCRTDCVGKQQSAVSSSAERTRLASADPGPAPLSGSSRGRLGWRSGRKQVTTWNNNTEVWVTDGFNIQLCVFTRWEMSPFTLSTAPADIRLVEGEVRTWTGTGSLGPGVLLARCCSQVVAVSHMQRFESFRDFLTRKLNWRCYLALAHQQSSLDLRLFRNWFMVKARVNIFAWNVLKVVLLFLFLP